MIYAMNCAVTMKTDVNDIAIGNTTRRWTAALGGAHK